MKYGTAHIFHLLPVKGMGDKAKDKDRDSNPNSLIRVRVGRQQTPTSRTWHLSKFNPDLLTNHPGTIGAGSM